MVWTSPGEVFMFHSLRTRTFGQKIHSYSKVTSTNDVAYRLALEGGEEGEVVLAREQTRGKGRGNHYWFSPPGSLSFSLILRPQGIASSQVPGLNILGAVGIAITCGKMFPTLSPQIRWPNDTVIGKRKVGGVLCRARCREDKVIFVVMGIGVNLNIEEFPPSLLSTATSLKRELGYTVEKETFLRTLLQEVEELYIASEQDFSSILDRARLLSSLLGKQVRVQTGQGEIAGLAQDLDEEGNLILRLESGIQRKITPEEGYLRL